MNKSSFFNDLIPVSHDESEPDGAHILWKPITEYQIVERCAGNESVWYNDDFMPELKSWWLHYDPIGQHTIRLRECHYELNVLLAEGRRIKDGDLKKEEEETNKTKKKCKGKSKARKTKKATKKEKPLPLIELPPSYSLPKFPANYPFKDSIDVSKKKESKIRSVDVNVVGFLQEYQIKELIRNFVIQVLSQVGYFVEDSQRDTYAIKFLSEITQKFLMGFINLMRYHKTSEVFSESNDLWGPLETTLQQIKFNGINGLHKFYYVGIVERHGELLKECEDILDSYKNLRKHLHESGLIK